ncbi:AAA family ATPase [Cryptosporangium sp. NPDC051539]|uniref:AAA family ATPase n=1 Tax=Cryptosporangium sp. NPDC051539 TaxID=3363962 RepID=UPI00379F0C60
MLTRIEIDGFKSFANFALDLNPFTVILGQNASGKSNFFDALQLLRGAVTGTLAEALSGERGQFSELFRFRGDGTSARTMRFAVEVLLRPTVDDPFEGEIAVDHTRVRYELEIRQGLNLSKVPHEKFGVGPVAYVAHESAEVIRRSDDEWVRRIRSTKSFDARHLHYPAKPQRLLSTGDRADGTRVFRLSRRGRAREVSALSAESTVLSSITTATDYPILYALRREIEGWRTLRLDPVALRSPGRPVARSEGLTEAGANLPAVLRRIEAVDEGALLSDLVADLARLIRGVTGLALRQNAATEVWEFWLRTRDDGEISARLASEGTLRILAVLAALYDPLNGSVLCFEEPENGIHPQRLRDFIDIARELVTDPAAEDTGAPLMQLLLTSHSPLVLLMNRSSDTVVFDWVSRVESDSTAPSRVTRARRIVTSTDRPLSADHVGAVVSRTERSLLTGISPAEAQSLMGA